MASDPELGAVLGIWAHPDDEAWLSAGLMMAALAAGARVACVTATRGEAGFAADDPRTLAERAAIRTAELEASLAIVGVPEHQFLDYPDGGCADISPAEPVRRLVRLIDDFRPDTVLTFGPLGMTGHPDHIAICQWASAAVGEAARMPRLLYATKSPDWNESFMAGVDPRTVMMVEGMEPESTPESELAIDFRCDDDLVVRKVAALRAQASQLDSFVAAMGFDAFTEFVRNEYFRSPRPADSVGPFS